VLGTATRHRWTAGAVLATVFALAACSPQAHQLTVRPSAASGGAGPAVAPGSHPATAAARPAERPVVLGTVGTFPVGQRQLTFRSNGGAPARIMNAEQASAY
jgi:hypothetical protein